MRRLGRLMVAGWLACVGAGAAAPLFAEDRLGDTAPSVALDPLRRDELMTQALADAAAQVAKPRRREIVVQPYLRWKEDSAERSWFFARTEAGLSWNRQTTVTVGHQYDELREPNLDTVVSHTARLAWEQVLGWHRLRSWLGWYSCGSCDEDTAVGQVTARGRWRPWLSAEAQVAREPHETAQARLAGIQDNRAAGTLWLGPWQGWSVRAYGREGRLSDRNRHHVVETEVARTVPGLPGLRAVYLATYEHMTDRTDVYYAPNSVRTHQAGIEGFWSGPRQAFLYARYLPGYGREKGVANWLVHTTDFNAGIEVVPGLQMEATCGWSRSPTYRSRMCQAQATHRF